MRAVLVALLVSLRAAFRRRAALQLKVLALRHQLAVYQRRHTRARIKVADRLLWAWLSRMWPGWRDILVFLQHRHRLAAASVPGPLGSSLPQSARQTRSRQAAPGPDPPDVEREPTLGGHRGSVGELAKLGIQVAKATVEKYMVRMKKPPSPEAGEIPSNRTEEVQCET